MNLFLYYNPALGTDPVYPVTAVDQVSLNVQIPITGPGDIGKDFYITLNNWNIARSTFKRMTDKDNYHL